MRALLGILIVAASSLGQSVSPFEFARLVDSHVAIDWDQVWPQIGGTEPPQGLPGCEAPPQACSAELIHVLDPPQLIVLVHGDLSNDDLYLRFFGEEAKWRFAGFYVAYVKLYPRRHELERVSGATFLKVSTQGASGSGIASEIERWFDLSQTQFEPIFSFTVQGYVNGPGPGINHEVQSSASWDWRDGSIRRYAQMRFSFYGHDLGSVEFSGTYRRRDTRFILASAKVYPAGTVVPLGGGMEIPKNDFQALSEFEGDPSAERMVFYAFDGLKKLASSADADTRKSLKVLLDYCDDTPEKQSLEKLLSRRR